MKFLLALVLTFVAISAQGPRPRLRVHVFYESLCPDSAQLINNQIYPDYPKLADWIELVLVPFGKSQSFNGGDSFTCQHGATECRLNRIQSCTLIYLDDEKDRVSYANCQMLKWYNSLPTNTGEGCVSQVGANWDEITACRDSDVGRDLQLLFESEQKRIIDYPAFIPTVTFNEKFNQELQDRAVRNNQFFKVTCELLDNAPPACLQ